MSSKRVSSHTIAHSSVEGGGRACLQQNCRRGACGQPHCPHASICKHMVLELRDRHMMRRTMACQEKHRNSLECNGSTDTLGNLFTGMCGNEQNRHCPKFYWNVLERAKIYWNVLERAKLALFKILLERVGTSKTLLESVGTSKTGTVQNSTGMCWNEQNRHCSKFYWDVLERAKLYWKVLEQAKPALFKILLECVGTSKILLESVGTSKILLECVGTRKTGTVQNSLS